MQASAHYRLARLLPGHDIWVEVHLSAASPSYSGRIAQHVAVL